MKILFYINLIDFGGAERVLVNLANEFSTRDNQVVVVTSCCKDNEYTLKEKVKRLTLEREEQKQGYIKKNIRRILKLRRICKSEKPDIVISFMAQANFRAILATRFLGIKTLISVRNSPDKEYPNLIYEVAAKTLYLLASGCVFQTKDAAEWFPKILQKKSEIILNQVSEEFYHVNYQGERKNIVTVGRLEPQKNYQLVIKAFSLVADKFPNENLIMFGEGSEEETLKELTKTLKIDNRVIFMGSSSKIQEKIKDAKLFILSSNYEGLPNVVMEAMTLGIPVISTDCPCGGPRMLINNGKNGILVPVNNVEKMAEAMVGIMRNSNLEKTLGENARRTAEEFKSDKVFMKWENYIRSIISN